MSTYDPAHDYSEKIHAWLAGDDEDDSDDDINDDFGDDDDDDEDDEDDENAEDPETWQVFEPRKSGWKQQGLRLTSLPEPA